MLLGTCEVAAVRIPVNEHGIGETLFEDSLGATADEVIGDCSGLQPPMTSAPSAATLVVTRAFMMTLHS
jgi:hypothetical protein